MKRHVCHCVSGVLVILLCSGPAVSQESPPPGTPEKDEKQIYKVCLDLYCVGHPSTVYHAVGCSENSTEDAEAKAREQAATALGCDVEDLRCEDEPVCQSSCGLSDQCPPALTLRSGTFWTVRMTCCCCDGRTWIVDGWGPTYCDAWRSARRQVCAHGCGNAGIRCCRSRIIRRPGRGR